MKNDRLIEFYCLLISKSNKKNMEGFHKYVREAMQFLTILFACKATEA